MLDKIAFGILGVLSFLPLCFGLYVLGHMPDIPVSTPVADWPMALVYGVAMTVVGFAGIFVALFRA